MKKLLTLLLMIFSLSCIFIGVGCGKNSADEPSYKITLDANGGSVNAQELEFKVGDDYTLPTPVKDGYTFEGWQYNNSIFPTSGKWELENNITLVAKYIANQYQVSVVDILNNPVSTTQVTYGESYEIFIPDSIKPMLKGLKKSQNSESMQLTGESWDIKENITLIAEYKPTTITFNLNGGTATFDTEIEVNYGDELDLTSKLPTKEDYSFDYWTYNGQKYEGGKWTDLVETAELTAVWKEAFSTYNVTIEDCLGNLVASKEVTYHKPYELPVPSSIENMLIGYKNSKTNEIVPLTGTSWFINEDITLIAEYKPTTITLNLNGGTATFDTEIEVNYGTTPDLSLYIPTKEDYAFDYWTYNGQKYEGGKWTDLVETAELTAVWKDIVCVVSIVDVLNNPVCSQEITYKTSYEITLPSNIQAMYEVLKVKDTNEEVALSGSSWKYKENITLVAVYKPTTITFNLNGGSATFNTEIVINYGEELDLSLYVPQHNTYPFVCWKYNGVKYEGGIWTNLVESAEFTALWKTWSDNH